MISAAILIKAVQPDATLEPSQKKQRTDSTDSSHSNVPAQTDRVNFFDELFEQPGNADANVDEVTEYIASTYSGTSTSPSNVLLYWLEKQKQWPKLATVARDLLSVPASSTSSE